jgi:hypothetical protein
VEMPAVEERVVLSSQWTDAEFYFPATVLTRRFRFFGHDRDGDDGHDGDAGDGVAELDAAIKTSERVRSYNCRRRVAHCARALLCTCIKSVLVPQIVTYANITEVEEVDRIVRILLHFEQAFDHHLAFVL